MESGSGRRKCLGVGLLVRFWAAAWGFVQGFVPLVVVCSPVRKEENGERE